jgi:hypothetical protein
VSRGESDRCGVVQTAIRNNRGGLNDSELTVPCPTSSWNGGDPVTVSASYPYRIRVFGIAVIDSTMNSTATERVE